MEFNPLLSMAEFLAEPHRMKPMPKYNAATEVKIPHPWWDLDRDSVHTNLKDISECIASLTKGGVGLDKELLHLLKTATRLEQVEREDTVKVALIGAQGAGKSLLINALLDSPGLSLTGAKGFACTSAIIKYAYGPGDRFAAEVKFLNARKREDMIDEHIRSYVDYHNDFEDSDDEGGPLTRSLQQDEIDRKRKTTAEDFFDTIFGSRDEFMCNWASSPVNTGEFKSICQLKCTEAMNEHDTNSQDIVHFSKNTPKELLEVIKPFLSRVNDKICLWPIVDCVTIRLNHALLQQGIEIIDLPGSGDINMLRARHADEVKDTVDVEVVLGDTGRIGTNELVISTVHAGVLNHGAARVKLVATKIDVLSDDELAQYTSDVYEQIDLFMQKADEDAAAAEDEGDDTKVLPITRYKQYLQRYKKAYYISERAKDITMKLGETLNSCSTEDKVEIFHTSTADYMNWIKTDKITFDRQPALSPGATGVPTIRRFLFDLPASQNLRNYGYHVNTVVPAFVEKLKRVVTQADCDAGFETIADEFDDLRARFLGGLVKQIKWHYVGCLKESIGKIKKDINAYKETVNKRIRKNWLSYKCATFTRILKGRGTVPRNASKAKGLEQGVNWNAELALIMKPGFQRWHATHTEYLKRLKAALPPTLDWLSSLTITEMEQSSASMFTVERAKMKWRPMRVRMQSKLMAMMDEMFVEEKKMLYRATLEDERENNIIASITDFIYGDVLRSTPELKPSTSGKSKRYVTPVFQFRKDRMEEHFFTDIDGHFVDRLVDRFKEQLQERMDGLVDKHFEKLNAMFDEFSNQLRDHARIAVDITPMGVAVRAELEKQIGSIENKAETLRQLVPATFKGEDDSEDAADDHAEEPGGRTKKDLSYHLEKAKKKKRNSDGSSTNTAKRVKQEPT